jgi:hypothetical protein
MIIPAPTPPLPLPCPPIPPPHVVKQAVHQPTSPQFETVNSSALRDRIMAAFPGWQEDASPRSLFLRECPNNSQPVQLHPPGFQYWPPHDEVRNGGSSMSRAGLLHDIRQRLPGTCMSTTAWPSNILAAVCTHDPSLLAGR